MDSRNAKHDTGSGKMPHLLDKRPTFKLRLYKQYLHHHINTMPTPRQSLPSPPTSTPSPLPPLLPYRAHRRVAASEVAEVATAAAIERDHPREGFPQSQTHHLQRQRHRHRRWRHRHRRRLLSEECPPSAEARSPHSDQPCLTVTPRAERLRYQQREDQPRVEREERPDRR